MSINFAALSYGVCAASFLLLFLLLLTRWRGRLNGAVMVAATLTTLLWAAVAALGSAGLDDSGGPVRFVTVYLVLETLRSSCWLALLFELLRPLLLTQNASLARLFYPVLACSAALLLAVELGSGVYLTPLLSFKIAAYGHLLYALCGLVLIENLFRNARREQRWATKFLFLGLGLLFVYDFYLYADALLLERFNLQVWSARGAVNALTVPLLAVTAARNPQWSLDIFVSRRMVVHSVAMIGAGLYLLAMAVAGYYVRFFGGDWGLAIQLVFFAGCGLLLAIMLFSGQLRSMLSVWLSKHFFNYKYDYREEWLRFGETLAAASTEEPPRQRAIRAVAQILHSPGGLLWTRDGDRLRLSTVWKLTPPSSTDAGIDVASLRLLERASWVIDLNDYRRDRSGYDGLSLPQWLLDRRDFWALVPLLQGERLIGFVLLAESLAPRQLNWEDWDLLKTAGRQVAGFIELLQANDALMDAGQFDAFNRLSAFVVHDLKNVSAQLALVVKNAEKHRSNPAFIDDAIATVGNASARMDRMLAQLRKGAQEQSAASTFDARDALAEAVASRAGGGQRPLPEYRPDAGPLPLHGSRDRFVAVIEHLLQNAQEATPADGRVSVSAERDGDSLRLRVSDTGSGMSAEFVRDRLFRPFVTTKGNAGMGIGVYECRAFVLAQRGSISVNSREAEGTEFELRLPLAADEPPAAVAERGSEMGAPA